MTGSRASKIARSLAPEARRSGRAIRPGYRVTRRDEALWLTHVAGFRDPLSPRAQRYAVAWNIRAKIAAALELALREGRPRESIFCRWEHASW